MWRRPAPKRGRRVHVKNVTMGRSPSTPTGWTSASSASSVVQVTLPDLALLMGAGVSWSSDLTRCFVVPFKDQEVASHCTRTQNTQCQCKAGRFCHPDHACEICKKCSRWVVVGCLVAESAFAPFPHVPELSASSGLGWSFKTWFSLQSAPDIRWFL